MIQKIQVEFKKFNFFTHPLDMSSLGEDLLPARLPSYLRHTPFTILSSAAMQRVRVFEGRKKVERSDIVSQVIKDS